MKKLETNLPFSYEVRRSKRRTLSIEITSQGEVLVRAPLLYPAASIEALMISRANQVQGMIHKWQQRNAAAPPPPDPQTLEAWRKEAKELLPSLVQQYASLMGVTPTRVTITKAKTRFGSCSGKNALSFSCRLMAYPQSAIAYVVVHELAHIKQHNHSAAFYAEVARVMPDYKARAAMLKQPPVKGAK